MFYHFKNIVYLNILHTKRGMFQIALFDTGEDSIRYRFLESKYLGNHFLANLDRNFINCALYEARWQTMQNMKWIQVLNFYTERCVRKIWFWHFSFVENYDESYCIIVSTDSWVHRYHHKHITLFTQFTELCKIQRIFCICKVFVRNSQRELPNFLLLWKKGVGTRKRIAETFFFNVVQRDPRKRRVKPVQKHLIQVDFGGADDSDDSDFELDKHKKGRALLISPKNNHLNWFKC